MSPAQGGQTLVVGSGGYATLGAAIAAAKAGDAILVHAGTYHESVDVDRQLEIGPFGDGPVWIDGQCSSTNGIHVSASGVVLRCLGVEDTVEAGVLIRGGDTLATLPGNVTVEGMTIQDFDCLDGTSGHYLAGISAYYTGPNIKLLGNKLQRRVNLSGSLLGHSDGIYFKSSSSLPSGGGHEIAHNTVVGGWDCFGGEPEGDVHGTLDHDSTIEDNLFTDCNDDGIQVDGADVNIVVRHNRVERAASGVSFAPNLEGPLTVESNAFVQIRPGALGGAMCFKVGDPGKGTAYLTGNVCSNPNGDGIQQTNSANGNGIGVIVSSGNTYDVARYIFEFEDSQTLLPGYSFDHDCMNTTDTSGRFVKWNNTLYGSLPKFQAATGQELNGQVSASCPTSVQ